MADPPLISICIPAYKRIDFVKRLLDSVSGQTFRDFEVIVTDDSPDESVKALCGQYGDSFPINYYRNPVSLGSPGNWNEAIGHARGSWIKLMHDDDWFARKNSLQYFVDAIRNNPSASFIFCAYCNLYADSGIRKNIFIDRLRYKMICHNPAILLATNSIGPPSAVLYKKDRPIGYDPQLKWLVDIDFYMRYLALTQPIYVRDLLINVGISGEQVTQSSFRNRNVEIPEYLYILEKYGSQILRSIGVFDAFWRLLRNLGIKKTEDIRGAGYSGELSPAIISIIDFQNRTPGKLLRLGAISKLAMLVCYLTRSKGQGK